MLTEIPYGYKEIIETFGNPLDKNFESRNITTIIFPYSLLYEGNVVTKGRCHKLAKEHFEEAFINIQLKGLEDQVKNYSGIYNFRPVRGGRKLSAHSFGIAIDLEALKYPLGSDKRFPQAVIDIFKESGFEYGGDFKGRKDGMHFQLCRGY